VRDLFPGLEIAGVQNVLKLFQKLDSLIGEQRQHFRIQRGIAACVAGEMIHIDRFCPRSGRHREKPLQSGLFCASSHQERVNAAPTWLAKT
jgi:hypothetical protein